MNRRSPHAAPRRGMVTHEMTVGIVLAASVVLGVVQITFFVTQQHRLLERRAAARLAAGNTLETLMIVKWDELDAATAEELSADDLPNAGGARMQIEIEDAEDTPAKRLTVSIHWPASGSPATAPVRLVAWRYPTEEAAP